MKATWSSTVWKSLKKVSGILKAMIKRLYTIKRMINRNRASVTELNFWRTFIAPAAIMNPEIITTANLSMLQEKISIPTKLMAISKWASMNSAKKTPTNISMMSACPNTSIKEVNFFSSSLNPFDLVSEESRALTFVKKESSFPSILMKILYPGSFVRSVNTK